MIYMRIAIACIAALLCVVGAIAAQPIDLRVVRDPQAEDYDFAWVYWFETHGRAYLDTHLNDRPLPWDTPASRRWRGPARDALVALLDDPNDTVRATAIIALARMQHAGLETCLIQSAERAEEHGVEQLRFDRSGLVRQSAWVALGLLDTEATRAALAVAPLEESLETDRAAQALAIGLLASPSQAHVRWLIDRLEDPKESLEVKRWCVWAMRQHDDPKLDSVFNAALDNLPSTFLISEVLLNQDYVQRRGGAPWLTRVLRYYPEVRGWAGYQALKAMPPAGTFGSTPRRLAMETRVAATLTLAQLPTPEHADDGRVLLRQLRQRIVAGNSAQQMDFTRGFDTIAYFMHCHAAQADLALLYDVLRGFATLSPDDPAFAEQAEAGKTPSPDELIARQSTNEVRGYAALAAGLLIQRATPGTPLHRERPIAGRRDIEIERLKRRFGIRLLRAVANTREPISYRAACALALGLTGDERYRDELAIELGKLQGGDEVVLGYGLLALAMLDDQRAAQPARRYLTRPGPVDGVGDVLGRRAALQAIGLLGERAGDDGRQALAGTWGRNRSVSLVTAQTTAWAGRYDVVATMIESTTSESVRWRATAARSLGLVFDATFPSRLSPLTADMNPTMSMRPVESTEVPDRVVIPSDDKNGLAPSVPGDWPLAYIYSRFGDSFFLDIEE